MIRPAPFLSLVLLIASPVAAQEVAISGPGTASCATYTQDRSLRINADGWILGFFTGMNTKNDNHMVGRASDARGIVAEVAKLCRDQPALTLFSASKRTYDRLASPS